MSRISDRTIAEYYKRDFDQKVFDNFKRRSAPPAQAKAKYQPRGNDRRGGFGSGRRPPPRPGFAGGGDAVSSAVKNSLLARSGRSGARSLKEVELCVLLFRHPDLAVRHAEIVAELQDRLCIMLDTDDVIDLSSFERAIEILGKYDVTVD